MHVRYSSERLRTGNEIKMIILTAIHHLCLHSSSPDFERLRAVRQFMEKITDVVQTSTACGAGCRQLLAPLSPASDESGSASSPGDSSSSGSLSEGDVEVPQQHLDTLAWLLPSKGMIHIAK